MILVDGFEIKFGSFPNKETNLNFNLFGFNTNSFVTLKFSSDQDLMNLFLLKKYMDDRMPSNRISLEILYMPYSRMDRRNKDYAFTLKYVSDFINAMDFYQVYVYDAHSEVTTALLNRCVEETSIPTLFRKFQEEHKGEVSVFYPDAGAQKRYASLLKFHTLVGFKHRNFNTGAIEKFEVHGEVVKGQDVVIIDDLCSKGGTFMASAAALKSKGAGDIYLIVGHCENTVHEGGIFAPRSPIKKVYTTDSIYSLRAPCNDKDFYLHPLYIKKTKEERI